MKSRPREHYEALATEILSRVWRREGDGIVVDPSTLDTPLIAVLAAEAGSTRVDPEWLPSDQQELAEKDSEELLAIIVNLLEERDEQRTRVLRTMLDFLFAKGPDPLAALERLFMLARALHEGHDWRMNQTEMGNLLGHSKQNWQQMEKKVITELVARYTRREFVSGGGKSWSATQKFAEQKKGNSSRRQGRRKGDEGPRRISVRDAGGLSAAAKLRAREMAREKERRDLAALCGCEPEEIDLDRITPSED